MKKMTATEANRNFTELMREVQREGSVILTKQGKDQCIVMSMDAAHGMKTFHSQMMDMIADGYLAKSPDGTNFIYMIKKDENVDIFYSKGEDGSWFTHQTVPEDSLVFTKEDYDTLTIIPTGEQPITSFERDWYNGPEPGPFEVREEDREEYKSLSEKEFEEMVDEWKEEWEHERYLNRLCREMVNYQKKAEYSENILRYILPTEVLERRQRRDALVDSFQKSLERGFVAKLVSNAPHFLKIKGEGSSLKILRFQDFDKGSYEEIEIKGNMYKVEEDKNGIVQILVDSSASYACFTGNIGWRIREESEEDRHHREEIEMAIKETQRECGNLITLPSLALKMPSH